MRKKNNSESLVQCAKLIYSVSLEALTRNRDFRTPLDLGITMLPSYLPLPPSFTVKQVLKKYGIFFPIL